MCRIMARAASSMEGPVGRWSKCLVPLGASAVALAGGVLPARAVAAVRVGTVIRSPAPQGPRAVRVPGVARPGPNGAIRSGGFGDGGGRFGDVILGGDDLGYGLAGGYVGGAIAQPADAGALPYGAPPLGSPYPGGPYPGAPFAGASFPGASFPGARPPAYPGPCVRPQIITIGRGVRGADKVRVVYGGPPCGR